MNWKKILGYALLVVGGLIALRFVVNLVFGVISFIFDLVAAGVALLVVGGLLYGGYRLLSWTRDDGSSAESDPIETPTTTEDRVERLKRKYADGKLSEEEFERRLDQEFSGPDIDSLDRKLTRERE